MEITSASRIIFDKSLWWPRHLLFWISYCIVFTLFSFTNGLNLYEAFESTALWLPVHFIYTYFIIYFLVPRFLIKEQYGRFFIYYTCWALAGLLLNFLFRAFVLIPIRTGRPMPIDLGNVYREIFAIFSFVILNTVAMFAVFIKMFKYWYGEQKQKLQIEKDKMSAELQVLKSQLQPHFLFNTLNNLYSLVNEKSDKAPAMLMRLSGLLSYVLYECRADEVLLEKEITIMKDYVALEKERYGDRLDVSLNFSGDIFNQVVPPMIFQPFVENAFKHGTSELLGKVWMSIDLSVKNNQLLFKIINSADGARALNGQGGIGIANIRRRLDIIYGNRFELKNGVEDDLYIVSLKINMVSRPEKRGTIKRKQTAKSEVHEDTLPGY